MPSDRRSYRPPGRRWTARMSTVGAPMPTELPPRPNRPACEQSYRPISIAPLQARSMGTTVYSKLHEMNIPNNMCIARYVQTNILLLLKSQVEHVFMPKIRCFHRYTCFTNPTPRSLTSSSQTAFTDFCPSVSSELIGFCF